MDSSKQIKYGAFISYIAIAFNILAGIIYTPWMIKVIGDSDYGIYGLAISVISMVTMDFGLGQAISRFIAKYIAQNDQKAIDSFLGITLKLYLVIDAVIGVVLFVLFFLLKFIYVSFTPDELARLRLVFVIIGAFTLCTFPMQIFNGVIQAYEKFVFQKLMDLAQKVIIVALMVAALFNGGGLYTLVVVNAGIGLLISVAKYIYLKSKGLFKAGLKSWDKPMVKELFSFSVWTTVMLILQRFIFNIEPTILGVTSGTRQIAIFNVSSVLEGYVYNLTGALGALFLTRVAKIYYGENQDAKAMDKLMIRVGRIQLFIVGAVSAIFFSLGGEFMMLWQGEKFAMAYPITIMMIAPSLITATQTIASTAITATGKLQYAALSYGVTAVVSCALSFIFSIKYGALGTGIGILAGSIAGTVVVSNIIYKKVLGLNIGNFFVQCHLKMSLPIVITTCIGFALHHFWVTSGWILFIAKCLIMGVIYVILMWLMGLNADEKGMILGRLRRG